MAALTTSAIAGIQVPSTDLTTKALAYVQKHNTPTTTNHVLRSTVFALIIAHKIPDLASCSPETIVLATLLHDLGWSTTDSLISEDKRFEVDGANAARSFLRKAHPEDSPDWTDSRLQLIWDAIALHTTPSIAMHKQPDVVAVAFGILADFLGPGTPGAVITIDEYKEVVTAYPRLGFAGEVQEIMCGLCKTKPETTYDNFVGQFGLRHVKGYKEQWEKAQMIDMLERGLKACEQWDN